MTTSRVLALLAALLVQWRVVVSSLGALADGSTGGTTLLATVALLLAGALFVVAAAWFALVGGGREWLARSLAAYLVVMAGYLVLGLALGRDVPWTAYAVLVAVAALGGGALAGDRRTA